MYLKRLELQGFKSFADKTIIDFEKGITGVVGPNGSGKSNISDSIRWVLGEQSAKTLRGAKMEDIIFSGTTKRRPVGFAEITLVLDNKDGKMPIDYSEVSVTRRDSRRSSNSKATKPTIATCPQCHEAKLPHRVCGSCGYYKNKEVINVG